MPSTTSNAVAQCIGTADGRILDFDDNYMMLLGATRGELTARHPLELTHPDDRGRNVVLLDALIARGEPFEITKRYRRPDGTTIWVRNHVSAYRDGLGEPRLLATCRPLEPAHQHDAHGRWRLARHASRLLRAGRRAFGDLVIGSVALELLLLLYRVEAEGRQATIGALAGELGYPLAIVERWLRALIDIDAVQLERGGQIDGGDAPVLLSRHGFATMEMLLAPAAE